MVVPDAMDAVTQVFDSLLRDGTLSGSALNGCSEREIAERERRLGAQLPQAYATYLRLAGKSAAGLLAYVEARFDHLDEIRACLASLDSWQPSSRDFVFMMHQEWEFTLFRLDEGDDPPVYQYRLGTAEPVLVWSSFSAFLADMAEDYRDLIVRP